MVRDGQRVQEGSKFASFLGIQASVYSQWSVSNSEHEGPVDSFSASSSSSNSQHEGCNCCHSDSITNTLKAATMPLSWPGSRGYLFGECVCRIEY